MSGTRTSEARATAQRLLDISGDALLSDDFEAFAACFGLPHTLATAKGMIHVETREEFRRVFDDASAYYAEAGVTKIDRVVETAVFDGPDTVRFSHITTLRNAGGLVKAPYSCNSVLRRMAQGWVSCQSEYAFANDPEQDAALIGPAAAASDDRQRGNVEARSVFQSLLDRITQAYLQGDFEALKASVHLPLFFQCSDSSTVLENEDALHADFKRYLTTFAVYRITDFVRLVKSAEFVGDRRMHGTYRTHVLRGTELLMPSYLSAMTVQQGEDRIWRVTTIMHPMGHLTLDRIVAGT